MSEHTITIDGAGAFTLGCAGVSEHCALWAACRHENCPPFDWNTYDGEHLHHGVEHVIHSGQWALPVESCALLAEQDVAADVAQVLGLSRGPGVYPLELSWVEEKLVLRAGGVAGVGGLWLVAGGSGAASDGSRRRPRRGSRGIGGAAGLVEVPGGVRLAATAGSRSAEES